MFLGIELLIIHAYERVIRKYYDKKKPGFPKCCLHKMGFNLALLLC